MEKISKLLIILTFPLILVLVAADLTVFNQYWYEQKFKQYDTYSSINTSEEVVKDQAKNILNHIQSKEPLNPMLLNEKEQLHLSDVKNLVTKGHQVLIVLMLLQLILWIKIKEKRKTLLYASLFTLIILALLIVFPFEQVFFKFHKIVFTNDFWLLNPATDNLIKMYPQSVFQAVALKIWIINCVVALLGLTGSTISLYKQKRQKNLWQKS